MLELYANGSAVNASRLLGELALNLQIRVRPGVEKAERIEVGFQISPTAECVEHALAFFVRYVQYGGRGGL
jgi:hypothetical protein